MRRFLWLGLMLVFVVPALCQEVQTSSYVAIGPCWVTDVIDGDSIGVRLPDGRPLDLRYMGASSPELEDEAHLGPQAKAENDELVSGRYVWLEVEPVEEGYRRDRNDRVLAYVFLDEERSQLVQAQLVEDGLALLDLRELIDRDLYPEAFPIRYAEELISFQIKAAREYHGLWGLPDFSPESDLAIVAVRFWGEEEAVYLLNRGAEPIELADGWILMDAYAREKKERGESSRNMLDFYRFFGPSCYLSPGGVLMILTGPGIPENRRKTLEGCETDRVTLRWFGYKLWDNEGDKVFLFDSRGELRFCYVYPWQVKETDE